ncbi:hypothetical protein AVEN_200346-1 [Araneus ventricosus]|uniref:Uncharacterized protein n=1 Tax=Araneus ventricosus TaxID=182803 RepID=A0A4Y2N1X0_ARAVE|nr:hypothetical protein AVEN_200346-1 [Araneus ventricosus]
MESSLAYPRGKEEKAETQKEGKNLKGDQTLGYVGVVNPVTSKEDVPLRGLIATKAGLYESTAETWAKVWPRMLATSNGEEYDACSVFRTGIENSL